jgi:ankyrin repeat protein
VCPESSKPLTAAQVLKKYTDDDLPLFLSRPIVDVNQAAIDGDRPIHIACVRGNLDDVVALFVGGADVNAAGDLGYTPLHHAASRGHMDIAKVLLNHGADVTAKNEFGQTPIDLARLMSKAEVAELLGSAKKARS